MSRVLVVVECSDAPRNSIYALAPRGHGIVSATNLATELVDKVKREQPEWQVNDILVELEANDFDLPWVTYAETTI